MLYTSIMFLNSIELFECPQQYLVSSFIAFTRLISDYLHNFSCLYADIATWWQLSFKLVIKVKMEQFCSVISGCSSRAVLPMPFCCSTSTPQGFYQLPVCLPLAAEFIYVSQSLRLSAITFQLYLYTVKEISNVALILFCF